MAFAAQLQSAMNVKAYHPKAFNVKKKRNYSGVLLQQALHGNVTIEGDTSKKYKTE